MKVIFLDIDGVLNTEKSFKEQFANDDTFHDIPDKECIENLNLI